MTHTAHPLSQARIQLISDGVVASYIHEISVRHRALESAGRPEEVDAYAAATGTPLREPAPALT